MERDQCREGYIKRRSYTRKNGTHVKSACIRKTSKYTNRPYDPAERQKNRLGRILGTKKKCPPGEVSRSAYIRRFTNSVRKSGYTRKTKTGKEIKVFPTGESIFVPSSCIKDVGKAGKLANNSQKIGPLRKGELRKFGYSYKLPEAERHKSLEKAIRDKGPLDTFRKLNAVAKLSSTAAPAASSVFSADRNWVRKMYSVNGSLKAF